MSTPSIRRLKPEDAADYRSIMLAAYEREPEAWKASVAEREPLPLEFWQARLAPGDDPVEMVFGAYVNGRLAGVVGLRRQQRPLLRHKATLYGLSVLPEYRRCGFGRDLVAAVLDQAAATPGLSVVQLTVSEPNVAARKLYESFGFAAFGNEPLAFRVGGRYVAQLHMWRQIGDPR